MYPDNYLASALGAFLRNTPPISETEFIKRIPKILDRKVNFNSHQVDNKNPIELAIELKWFHLAKLLVEHEYLDQNDVYHGRLFLMNGLIAHAEFDLLRKFINEGFGKDEFNTPLVQQLWTILFYTDIKPQLLTLIKELAPECNAFHDKTYEREKIKSTRQREKALHHRHPPITKKHRQFKGVMKNNLTKIAYFMTNKSKVTQGLKKFEQRLAENWLKEFPNLDINAALGGCYTFHSFAGDDWPLPTEQFKHFNKNSFLERHSLAHMREQGFEGKFSKFYTAAPENRFKTTILEGEIFTESSLNPHFLTHGKNTHNIGRILLSDAWADLKLDDYETEDFQSKKMTRQEIFEACFDEEYKSTDDLLGWSALFDIKTVDNTFSDPWQFHAFLMKECQDTLPHLSLLMKHSFCKGILRIKQLIQDYTGQPWTTENVWRHYITPRIPNSVAGTLRPEVKWLSVRKNLKVNELDEETVFLETPHKVSLTNKN